MQGEEEALRTVECLRGRLLAERAASKAATDTADLMTTKLKELEEKIKIEQKCRRKAEKRLSILKKKLESLKIGFNISNIISEESDQSSSSSSTVFSGSADHVSISSSSSTASSSSNNNTGFRSDDLIQLRSMDCSNSCPSKNENNADRGERIEAERKVESVQEPENQSGLNPSKLEEKRDTEDDEKEEDDHDVDVDNSMALVLSSPVESENPSNREMKVDNERVRELLDTLKEIRENLQSTMERRRMIQVG